jgi:hypothetical protein
MEDIIKLDQRFAGKGAVKCPHDGKPAKLQLSEKTVSDHGHLAVHGSGAFLICGICGYQQPVGRA